MILASYMIIRVVIRIFTLLLPCISLSKNPLYFPMQYVLEAYNALIINTCLCVKVPSGGANEGQKFAYQKKEKQ